MCGLQRAEPVGCQSRQGCRGRSFSAFEEEYTYESSHGFLATGQVLHVAEALQRRHGVVFDTAEIWLVCLFEVEICLASEGETGCPGQFLVHLVDLAGDVVVGLCEELLSVFLDFVKSVFGLFGGVAADFELLVCRFEASLGAF